MASSAPVPPCKSPDFKVDPQYGALNGPPTVGVWRDTILEFGDKCPSALGGRAKLAVALASRFVYKGTLEDLAARVGAVSATEEARYWSVTDGAWRVLISTAFAVEDPTTRRRRPDFTAKEVLSGKTLYLVQKDTRSTGLNMYSLTATSHGPDQLTVSMVNLTDIRFLFATLFKRRTLISVHFLKRLHGDEWGYYGLTVVKEGAVEGQAKSFINRAAAYHRLLTGEPTDKAPPLAR